MHTVEKIEKNLQLTFFKKFLLLLLQHGVKMTLPSSSRVKQILVMDVYAPISLEFKGS